MPVLTFKVSDPEARIIRAKARALLRVSMQVFGYTLTQSTAELSVMRRETGGFVDQAPPPGLPPWPTTAGRTSDGYLIQLAASVGMKLATLDAGIKDPTAELIP